MDSAALKKSVGEQVTVSISPEIGLQILRKAYDPSPSEPGAWRCKKCKKMNGENADKCSRCTQPKADLKKAVKAPYGSVVHAVYTHPKHGKVTIYHDTETGVYSKDSKHGAGVIGGGYALGLHQDFMRRKGFKRVKTSLKGGNLEKGAAQDTKTYNCPECKKPSVHADHSGWRDCSKCGWKEKNPAHLTVAKAVEGGDMKKGAYGHVFNSKNSRGRGWHAHSDWLHDTEHAQTIHVHKPSGKVRTVNSEGGSKEKTSQKFPSVRAAAKHLRSKGYSHLSPHVARSDMETESFGRSIPKGDLEKGYGGHTKADKVHTAVVLHGDHLNHFVQGHATHDLPTALTSQQHAHVAKHHPDAIVRVHHQNLVAHAKAHSKARYKMIDTSDALRHEVQSFRHAGLFKSRTKWMTPNPGKIANQYRAANLVARHKAGEDLSPDQHHFIHVYHVNPIARRRHAAILTGEIQKALVKAAIPGKGLHPELATAYGHSASATHKFHGKTKQVMSPMEHDFVSRHHPNQDVRRYHKHLASAAALSHDPVAKDFFKAQTRGGDPIHAYESQGHRAVLNSVRGSRSVARNKMGRVGAYGHHSISILHGKTAKKISQFGYKTRRDALKGYKNLTGKLPGTIPMAKSYGLSKAVDKVHKVMHEFKHGELHSGSKHGPKVKNRKQAIAIALGEARAAGQKVAAKKSLASYGR